MHCSVQTVLSSHIQLQFVSKPAASSSIAAPEVPTCSCSKEQQPEAERDQAWEGLASLPASSRLQAVADHAAAAAHGKEPHPVFDWTGYAHSLASCIP